jgi:hypothetical protein
MSMETGSDRGEVGDVTNSECGDSGEANVGAEKQGLCELSAYCTRHLSMSARA